MFVCSCGALCLVLRYRTAVALLIYLLQIIHRMYSSVVSEALQGGLRYRGQKMMSHDVLSTKINKSC